MIKLLRNLALIVGTAFVLFLGYRLFFGDSGAETLVRSNNANLTASGVNGTNQELLLRLQELRTIDLDTGVFSDERFLSLENFRSPLDEEPTGRANPFAPVVGR